MTNAEVPELGLPLFKSGKVRDSYLLGDDHLLVVTSDRISAFDVVLEEEIPNKGRVLNGMSDFWFDYLADIVPNQGQNIDHAELDLPEELSHPHYLGRVSIARRAEMVDLECIVRGHLTGSAWADYQESGTVHGMKMPAGMKESQAFPKPIFTPSTKAPEGGHDQNISFEDAVDIVGAPAAFLARSICLRLYQRGYDHAAANGMTIADTKFELGQTSEDNLLILCDEVFTPDSSRFWPTDQVVVGKTPPSLDKQYIRDYLTITMGWDKRTMPPPPLTDAVIRRTSHKYIEAYTWITGRNFYEIPGSNQARAR